MWEDFELTQTHTTVQRSLLAGAALLTLGLAGQARAAGFYLEDQSTKASGRAFSGEAADMGAASMFYNPAAIAGISQSEIEGSITPILVDARVSDSGSTIKYLNQTTAGPVGGTPNAFKPVELGVIPASASAVRINDQFSFGLAITSPFSFATKYDDSNAFVRYSALTTRLTTIDLQPTLAWRPVRWLGIGAGPVIEYTDALLSNALPQLGSGSTDGRVTLRGNGWDAGYTVGAQLHPTEAITIGGAYRSKISHTLTGDAKLEGLQGLLAGENQDNGASASFNTPWSATFSVRWKVTDKLTLEGQGVRFGWSEFHQIALNDATAPLPNQLENYHDTTSGAVGFDYDLTPRLTVRAGIQYDPTPTPDVGRDARVPDGDRFLFAGGYSFRVNPHIVLDGAASYIDFIPSHINRDASEYGNVPGTNGALNVPINIQGEVNASAETLSMGAHFYF